MLSSEEEKTMPPAQRLRVLKMEIEARLAALEGGVYHGDAKHAYKEISHLKWLAAKCWELEQEVKRPTEGTQ